MAEVQRPSSSERESAGEANPGAASSSLASGSTFSGAWQVVAVRDKLSGGAFASQFGHGCAESAARWTIENGIDPPEDTRIAVLGATKARLQKFAEDLAHAGISHTRTLETDGELTGKDGKPTITTVALITTDKPRVDEFSKELKPARLWRVGDGSEELLRQRAELLGALRDAYRRGDDRLADVVSRYVGVDE